MHPYRRASMASAFSNRALSLNGAFGLSKSSVENFLKHPQAILVRRLISRVMSASSVMRPPRYTNWWTWWYFWPAAAISSAGRGGVGYYIQVIWLFYWKMIFSHFGAGFWSLVGTRLCSVSAPDFWHCCGPTQKPDLRDVVRCGHRAIDSHWCY